VPWKTSFLARGHGSVAILSIGSVDAGRIPPAHPVQVIDRRQDAKSQSPTE
jgi:hypothetical protein